MEKGKITMTNNNTHYNDRIEATVTEMKADRKRQRRQTTAPIIITGIVSMALIAGASVGGVALIKNINPAKNATQSAATKITNSAQSVAQKAYSQNSNTAVKATEAANPQSNVIFENKTEKTWSAPVKAESAQETKAAETAKSGKHHSGAMNTAKGTPLHFRATGKTSYGYDWNYEGGSGLVKVGCDYTFANNEYDFSLIGKAPGVGTIKLYYNVGDSTKASATINFTVDEHLNVTCR